MNLEYKGIPVVEDTTLQDDEIVMEGYDKEGHLITMRFRFNPKTQKMELMSQ